MIRVRRIAIAALAALALAAPASGQTTAQSSIQRDGAHDMDFDFGTWRTHSSRLLHPLTGSTDWVDMDGSTIVKPIWGGRGNLAEFKGEGPAGVIELLALRLCNPATHQWLLNFATPGVGTLGVAGLGRRENGRIEFYDQEDYQGRSILLRFSIWGITPDTAQSEQAFSADGGKTWETNWINRYTRVKDARAGAG